MSARGRAAKLGYNTVVSRGPARGDTGHALHIVDPDGHDWILQRIAEDGTITSIRLSAENVLSILESAPFLQDRVTARHPGAGGTLPPTFAVPFERLDVGADALDNLLLRATLPNGLRLTYSLSQDQAKQAAEAILARAPDGDSVSNADAAIAWGDVTDRFRSTDTAAALAGGPHERLTMSRCLLDVAFT